MDPTIRQRVQWIIQDYWQSWQSGPRPYAETRDHVLRTYPQLYPIVNQQAWDMALRDAVIQCVRELVSEQT